MRESGPKVGFVVIGRNEGQRLDDCLRSVATVGDCIAYADSASQDGSPELAERLGAVVARLPQDGKLNAARGRNAGYAALLSRYPDCEFVQFLDGDCILQPNFVQQATRFLRDHPKVGVVCGQRFEAHPDASIYNALCEQEWNTPVGKALSCGGDALMRRSALDAVGGYNESLLAGEEPEMTARMRHVGWEIWRIDAKMTEHDARMRSFRQWWRRSQRGGFGYAQVWSLTRTLPERLYGRQLRSALTWAFAIPLLFIAIALLTGRPSALIFLPLVYLLQVVRIGLRSRGATNRWTNASLLVVAKFPELIGASQFFWSGQARSIPEYKSVA